jgi:N-acyl-D-aspartate/D-glutamate deacylase
MEMPNDITPRTLAEVVRVYAYTLAATLSQDQAERLATSLDAVATWKHLDPAAAQLLQVLAKDAQGFAQGQPRSPLG